jgi:hypothetical protein
MTRTKPSHRSDEQRGVEADGDGIMVNNDNNQDNGRADVPLPAAVAASLTRRFRRSPRHATNNDNDANRGVDAPNEPGTDSSSKRKRKFDASELSLAKRQPRISKANENKEHAATTATAADDSCPAPNFASSSSIRRSTNSFGGGILKKRQTINDKDDASLKNNAVNNNRNDDVLEAFCRMLSQGAPQQSPGKPGRRPPPIDIQKAANVLEAAAGRLAMAVNLYWDDYFASFSHYGAEAKNAAAEADAPSQKEENEDHIPYAVKPSRKVRFSKTCKDRLTDAARAGESFLKTEGADDNNGDEGDRKQPARRRDLAELGERELRRTKDDGGSSNRSLRRSLDPDFRDADLAFGGDNPSEEEFRCGQDADDEMKDADDQDHNNHMEEESSENEDGHRGADVINVAINDGDASISVSDEEVPGRFARTRLGRDVRASAVLNHPMSMQRRIREAAAAISKKVLNFMESADAPKKRRKSMNEGATSLNDELYDYVSDSDWLESHPTSALELLWGKVGTQASGASTGVRIDENNSINNNAEGRANPVNVEEDEIESVDALEDDSQGLGIPYTWLNEGFHLSECGTGLVVQIPKADDISFLAWRQRNMGTQRNALPPPIHCMGITSILSLVTSLLYTGATIQGDVVTCTSAQKPWSDLTSEERKNEFDDRLTDALSALVFIAAKTSQKRKRRALRQLQNRMTASPKKPSAEDIDKEKTMIARLNLVPTCIWEENLATALVPRTSDGPAFCHVRIKTSLTNIKDIKLYVLSTIRAFTSKGGIALLLETLVRIHGIQALNRQMSTYHKYQIARHSPTTVLSQTDQEKSPGTGNHCNLIRCTCEERQKEAFAGKPLPSNIRNDPSRLILQLTPPGNDCVFDGLLCLLLCGEIKRCWNDFVPQGLGVGLLTGISLADTGIETSLWLSRPERPVWMLKGPTCYSALFIEEGKDFNVKTVAKVDKAQSSIQICHWSSWYGQTHKSELRIVTGPSEQSSSKVQQQLSKVESQLELKLPISDRVVLERSWRRLICAVSKEQHLFVQTRISKDFVGTAEINRLKIHPEDEKLYPNKRQMWRFDMGEDMGKTLDEKPRAQRWTPYHRLNEREKRIVELKLGPKINQILWTRWPASTIDSFTNDPVV